MAIANEAGQRLLQGVRALALRHRDLLLNVLQSIAANMLPSPISDNEQLRCRHTAAAFTWDKHLREDSRQRHGQFLANRVLPFRWERVRYPGDSRRNIRGVQC